MTGIVVCYNTPELISLAVSSIKRFYNSMPIIIVDGSPKNSPCYKQCDIIKNNYANIKVFHTYKNLGHGPGLNIGINQCKGDFFIFDSDIEMMNPCIEKMRSEIGDSYGIGTVVKVDEKGINSDNGIDYLHPYFAVINRAKFDKFPKFRHCGAPAIDIMKALKLNSVPVKHFDLSAYILHKERGTREKMDTRVLPRKVWKYGS